MSHPDDGLETLTDDEMSTHEFEGRPVASSDDAADTADTTDDATDDAGDVSDTTDDAGDTTDVSDDS